VNWTQKTPEVSGYYWLKEKEYLMATATEPRKPTGAYCTPKVVKVTINDDPDWPDVAYLCCGEDGQFDFQEGDLWAGPIPPPSN
jgi:hypothetical protein